MGSISTRLEKLEQRRPPVMHRPDGETFDAFMARFCVALEGVPADQITGAVAPWIAAMRHEELRWLERELRAIDDGQARAECT